MGPGITCAQCGGYQQFDHAVWGAALLFAHDVGELGGYGPEGQFPHPTLWIGEANPYRAIGRSETFATHEDDDFKLEASPGAPACAGCDALYDLRTDASGLVARCPRCGVESRYTLPASLAQIAPAVLAALSEEQRLDRVEVRVRQTTEGLQALACPKCGGALSASNTRVLACPYCGTASFLPVHARAKGPGYLAPPIVFWVAFRGRSTARVALERPRVENKANPLAGLLGRGLKPLPGIELAPVRPGADFAQLALTLGLTALALGVGYLIAQTAGWI
jgi:Zn finger protein HypA/HybF involved in hydrogenase expression